MSVEMPSEEWLKEVYGHPRAKKLAELCADEKLAGVDNIHRHRIAARYEELAASLELDATRVDCGTQSGGNAFRLMLDEAAAARRRASRMRG